MGGWWISLAEGMYLACAAAEGGATRKLQVKFSCIKYLGGGRTGLGQKRVTRGQAAANNQTFLSACAQRQDAVVVLWL